MNLHVPYTQAGRMMAVSTRLGPDVLLLDGLDVDEMINGLFTLDSIALEELVIDQPQLTLTLPELQSVAGLFIADERAARRAMVFDTLSLDIADRRRAARAFLLWRTTFEPDRFTSAVQIGRRDLGHITAAVERGAA